MQILNFLLYFALTVLGLGVLIFVHELGHYLTARACHVTVHEFSLGMGKRLCGFTSKKTGIQYSLRLLPIGGYVAMAGEDEGGEGAGTASRRSGLWKGMRRMLGVSGSPTQPVSRTMATYSCASMQSCSAAVSISS